MKKLEDLHFSIRYSIQDSGGIKEKYKAKG